MRFLAIIDPPATLNPTTDTTIIILQEMMARGHEAWVCHIDGLSLNGSNPMTEAWQVLGVNLLKSPALVTQTVSSIKALEEFHGVLIRKDPPFDQTYLFATLILEHARGRTFLMNDPQGLRNANEKLYIFNFPKLIAPTIVSRQPAQLKEFLKQQEGHIMIKPLDGFGGQGVFYVREEDANTNAILEVTTQDGHRWVMAQRYLPEGKQGDKRIILLNGRPIGALLRVPQGHDARSNLRAGGKAYKTELTAKDHQICEALAPRLLKDGLYFAGIDVIGGYLTEVNVTSPTGVQVIDRLENVQLEKQIVDFIEQSSKTKGS